MRKELDVWIRFVDGPRKGEVCNVMPHTAEHLCNVGTAVDAQGAAEVPDVEVVEPVPFQAPQPPPAPTSPPPTARRTKKAKAKRRS